MNAPQLPWQISFEFNYLLRTRIENRSFIQVRDVLVQLAEGELYTAFPSWYDSQYMRSSTFDWNIHISAAWEDAIIELTLDYAYGPSKHDAVIPAGYFVNRYGPLEGSDWLRTIDKEDRVALAHIANSMSDYGRAGGSARARTARRQPNGRFATNV